MYYHIDYEPIAYEARGAWAADFADKIGNTEENNAVDGVSRRSLSAPKSLGACQY